MSEYYLVHHGILGMRWGVRRYQNKDGSLTVAGKKRYLKKMNPELKREKVSQLAKSLQEVEDSREEHLGRYMQNEFDASRVLAFIDSASAMNLKNVNQFLNKNSHRLSSADEFSWEKAVDLWLKQDVIGQQLLSDLKLDDRFKYITEIVQQTGETIEDGGGVWRLKTGIKNFDTIKAFERSGTVDEYLKFIENDYDYQKRVDEILEKTSDWTWEKGKKVPNKKKVKQMGAYSP